MVELIRPHGGELKVLLVSEERAKELKGECINLPSLDLTPRQMCDVELLLNGAFSPLTGFLNREDYDSVLQKCRLNNGLVWPVPINLDVNQKFAETIKTGSRLVLRDSEGVALAVLTVSDVWKPDKLDEALKVFGTTDELHPGVYFLLNETEEFYVGGTLEGLELPSEYTFKEDRLTPKQLRDYFTHMGWSRVVGFQTRNPMHRAHYELTIRAAAQANAALLLNPVVGLTKPGDLDYFTRVRCYKKLLKYYPENSVKLCLLPLAMRMAGPREALWHALIRKNYGCTHFIVGRDHAGPGKGSDGKPFYGPYDAQDFVRQFNDEIGIRIVPFKEMIYVRDKAQFMPASEVPQGSHTLKLSGTEFRRRLKEGLPIPDWFSFPEIISELRRVHPDRKSKGFTLFFTGLSGSGKSTIANAVVAKLNQLGNRPVTLLDGDVVRKHLSSELGFSREHRDLNILRIGFVASEITKNKGIAVCAPIAPYQSTRARVRGLVSRHGAFILIHVATPLDVCEGRDRKGLYAKARAGLIKDFTGIDDPYEEPKDAEIKIDTTHVSREEAANHILFYLRMHGYLQ